MLSVPTSAFRSGIGESNFDGSKFPCKVIWPPERYRAFLAEHVQSIPKAAAPDLASEITPSQYAGWSRTTGEPYLQ